ECPMHPEITSKGPSRCPLCSMQLTPIAAGATPGRTILFYRSPSDPKQSSHTPMKDEHGKDYLPVYDDEVGGAGAKGLGMASVSIDAERQQLIGLKTVEATSGPIGGSWRTVGRIAVDETRVRHVNVKVDGFVEKLYVDFVGKPVRKGQPLFSLYSPELVSVQNEYLLALKTQKALSAGGSLNLSGDSLVSSARQRLLNWDIPASTIDQLEATGQPQRTLTFVSPISGVVTEKTVFEGMKLTAGDMPLYITDLSQVWVLADVYESDLSRVTLGMMATLTLQALPNRTFKGKVNFIDPVLDPKTRTAKVRVEVANPKGELRPDQFGEVVFQKDERQGLSIPADAVIDSGTRKVVFIALGGGKFQPRVIEVGVASGDRVEVLSGLAPGDQVVTRANFLMDSESRLKAILQSVGTKP
ncbi:MAG: efflux RND transporter periplasmic adaptor subunit, partial [Myxococcaceae bacterium]